MRETYLWVSESSINGYFYEICYKINCAQSKAGIFNTLITKEHDYKINRKEIIGD